MVGSQGLWQGFGPKNKRAVRANPDGPLDVTGIISTGAVEKDALAYAVFRLRSIVGTIIGCCRRSSQILVLVPKTVLSWRSRLALSN